MTEPSSPTLSGIQALPGEGSPMWDPVASHPPSHWLLLFQQALSSIDQHSLAGANRQASAFKGEAGTSCPRAKEGSDCCQHWFLRGHGGGLAWNRRVGSLHRSSVSPGPLQPHSEDTAAQVNCGTQPACPHLSTKRRRDGLQVHSWAMCRDARYSGALIFPGAILSH